MDAHVNSPRADVTSQRIDQQMGVKVGNDRFPRFHPARILACTDFSPASQTALGVVASLWRDTFGQVSVLHVCETGPIPATTDDGILYLEELQQRDRNNLRAALEKLRAKGIRAESMDIDGNAPTVILEEIRRQRVDLVVLGTRATRGVERFVFGSTAEAVFRSAPCPVLTVGSQSKPIEGAERPVVFATDFHETSEAAIHYAAAIANTYAARLHCLHVLPLSAKEQAEPIIETIMNQALAKLASTSAQCEREPVSGIAYGSDVSHSIVEYAREKNAQMIVLGVRKKSRVASHLPPQRTYRIIMTASCPVMTLCSTPEVARSCGTSCL